MRSSGRRRARWARAANMHGPSESRVSSVGDLGISLPACGIEAGGGNTAPAGALPVCWDSGDQALASRLRDEGLDLAADAGSAVFRSKQTGRLPEQVAQDVAH